MAESLNNLACVLMDSARVDEASPLLEEALRIRTKRLGDRHPLVAQSLVAFREIGMTDAVLGVDADNPTGALGVYEANGFVVHQTEKAYRRTFD